MPDDLTSKLPFRENIKYIKTILLYTHRVDKAHYPLCALRHLLNAANGALKLILSARILEALFDARPMAEVMKPVILLLAVPSLLEIVSCVLQNEVIDPRRGNVLRVYNGNLSAKFQSMDYSLIDSPYVKKLSDRIARDNNWGSGIWDLFWDFDVIVSGFFSLLCSGIVALPILRILLRSRSPWLWLGLAALLLILAALAAAEARAKAAYDLELLTDPLRKDKFTDKLRRKYLSFTSFWGMRGMNGEYHYIKDIHLYGGYDMMYKYTVENYWEQEKIYPWAKTLGGLSGREGLLAGAGDGLVNLTGYVLSAAYAMLGAFPVGSVIKFADSITNIGGGLYTLRRTYSHLCLTARRAASTMEMLSISDEMYKGKLPVEKRLDNRYEIEFRNVSFRYPGRETYALRNFSLKLRIGERMAIVGMNGSGKTTLIKLLCRLYDPQEGEILLNGVDIRKFKQDEYIRLFSVVFQDFELLALPLGQNVAASVHIDEALAAKCLRQAGLGERLARMPEGLDTPLYKDVSDDGVEISGGEAQKIAIARALYKDAPFVLLDEPTASLDPLSEYEIYSKFDAMVGDKTAIYISHRLSSCRFCNDIAVLHEGRLVQRGSHERLLRDKDGKYYALWQAQAQYYA